jgi:hypothetical protein
VRYNKIDMSSDIGKSLKQLIDMDLVTLFDNDDTGETLMTLTEQGMEVASTLSDLIDEEEEDNGELTKFLQNVKKELDSLIDQ